MLVVVNEKSDYVGVREAASLLGVHENTVRNWIKTGVLTSARLPGTRQHRFRREDVERLLKDQGADASSRVESLKAFGPELVTANDLDAWTGRFAQERFPELVRRLLRNTVEISNLSVRAGDGISAPGFDGIGASGATGSFLPTGKLIMEMGTDADPVKKATSDYQKRVKELAGATTSAHFIFLTPRRWRNAADWQKKRTEEGHFASVRVLDADDLEGWLQGTPSVHIWVSELFGRKPHDAETIERRWGELAAQTNPELPLRLFTAGREEEATRVQRFIEGEVPGDSVLRVRAAWRDEVVGFLAAVAFRAPDTSVILLHSKEAWGRVLSDSKVPLVVIPMFPGANLALADERNHRVIIPVTPQDSFRNDSGVVELSRLSVGEASQSLQEAGLERERANRLAGLARRSMRAFVRDLARDERGLMPEWAMSDDRRAIANLVLVQQWSDGDEDLAAMTSLSNLSPDELEGLLVRWEAHEDPPFIRSGSAWRVAAPVEAALVLLPMLTSQDLVRWSKFAVEVLTELDPTANMVEGERLLAAMNGVKRKYSSILREGFASGLALLGQAGAVGLRQEPGADVAARIVRDILQTSDLDQERRTWLNVAPHLPSLAEAAPEAFLGFVERDLDRSNPILASFFESSSEDGGLFGPSSPHVHLLWALEVLSHSADYFFRAAEALSRLVPFDSTLGNTLNRASESLRVLLLPWMRQTDASLKVRLAFLRSWAERDDVHAWPTLLKLMPGGHDVALMSAAPKFRDWVPEDQTVSLAEWSRFVEELASIVLDIAGDDLAKWADVVTPLSSLPQALREPYFDALDAAVARSEPGHVDAAQDKLFEALRGAIGRHREFPDAEWALPEKDIARLERVFSELTPSDLSSRYGYLFGWHPRIDGFDRYASEGSDIAGYERELERQRLEALELTAAAGSDALRSLVLSVDVPQQLGAMLVEVAKLVDLPTVLEWLEAAELNLRSAAAAYVSRRSSQGDLDWVESTFNSEEDTSKPELLAASLSPRPAVWTIVDKAGLGPAHWNKVSPYAVAPEDRPVAVERLIGVGRAEAALNLVGLAIHQTSDSALDVDLILKSIQALLDEERSGPMDSHSGYVLGNILDHLRKEGVPDETLAAFEFPLFRVLEGSQVGTPSLFRVLASDPRTFSQLVEMSFRASNAAPSDRNDGNRALASLAYQVLMEWRSIPGRMEDGSVDADVLRNWVEQSRLLLSASDRADIGDELIGQLLSAGGSSAPEGWPARGVAQVIESTASVAMESGLYIGLMNGRGVTVRDPFEGGKLEHELAARFEALARENQEWSRTSRVLKSVAARYERDALDEDRKAQWLGDEG